MIVIIVVTPADDHPSDDDASARTSTVMTTMMTMMKMTRVILTIEVDAGVGRYSLGCHHYNHEYDDFFVTKKEHIVAATPSTREPHVRQDKTQHLPRILVEGLCVSLTSQALAQVVVHKFHDALAIPARDSVSFAECHFRCRLHSF